MTFRFEPQPELLSHEARQQKEQQAQQELLNRIVAQREWEERARRRFDRLPEELAARK
ncbi:hypothetical protein [Nitrospina watsonii]|uniref:Uncharacterized protein n=1 Tax=Nitrospina watsonii TaxID=1323948 RepID=A0ABM9HHK8_9BACT|nr:hypothetical protein [Nitrospina watsonii]CAI2719515.1 conserved protein of unknown function [Nitrospina watsonii]